MKRMTAVTGLLVMVAVAASAYGGGFFQGAYFPVQHYTNMNREAEIVGGYGYSADRDGSRHGGFGIAIHDARSDELIGAFGGVISGSQVRTGPLTLSLSLWSGIGYVNPAVVHSPVRLGYFLEADAEAGFALLPWFQLSVYAGMQAMGSFDASALISSARYTPVVGSRLSWGSF